MMSNIPGSPHLDDATMTTKEADLSLSSPMDQDPPPPNSPSLFSQILLKTPSKNVETFRTLSPPQQLNDLLSALSLSPKGKEKRVAIICELNQILSSSQFSPCRLLPIGSNLTELDHDDSNLDIYVHTEETGSHDTDTPPLPGGVDRNQNQEFKQSIATLLKETSYHKFLYQDVKLTPPGKCAGFGTKWKKHEDQELLNVSLSFGNEIEVKNSEMVLFYTRLQPVLLPLLKLVHCWAKCHELDGPGGFKSYCLTLMVLTFAGYEEIIPSAEKMQSFLRQGDNQIEDVVNKIQWWDVTIPTNPGEILSAFPSKFEIKEDITTTVIELLKEFFKFYAQLDFEKDMICTNTFEIVSKQSFRGVTPPNPDSEKGAINYQSWLLSQKNETDPSYSNEKEFFVFPLGKILCVQDLFTLNKNLGAGTGLQFLIKFQLTCREMVNVFEEKPTSSFLTELLSPVSIIIIPEDYLTEAVLRDKASRLDYNRRKRVNKKQNRQTVDAQRAELGLEKLIRKKNKGKKKKERAKAWNQGKIKSTMIPNNR